MTRTIRRHFWGFRALWTWLVSIVSKPTEDGTLTGGALAYALKANGYQPTEPVIPLVPRGFAPNHAKRRRETRRRAAR